MLIQIGHLYDIERVLRSTKWLGTLINLDLPWNPTRLEQRKGRVQRIGQVLDVVNIYNMWPTL